MDIVKRKHRKGFHVDVSLRNSKHDSRAQLKPIAQQALKDTLKTSEMLVTEEQLREVAGVIECRMQRQASQKKQKGMRQIKGIASSDDYFASFKPGLHEASHMLTPTATISSPDISLPADVPNWVPWVAFTAGLGIIPMAFLATPIAIALCALALFFGFWGLRNSTFGPLSVVGLVLGFIYLFYLVIIGIFMLSVYLAFL